MTTAPRTPIKAVPPPDKERKVPVLSSENCQKCGATFQWERSEADNAHSPLALRVRQGSPKCDCGFGRPRGELPKPSPR